MDRDNLSAGNRGAAAGPSLDEKQGQGKTTAFACVIVSGSLYSFQSGPISAGRVILHDLVVKLQAGCCPKEQWNINWYKEE